jgi:hypothetical protein
MDFVGLFSLFGRGKGPEPVIKPGTTVSEGPVYTIVQYDVFAVMDRVDSYIVVDRVARHLVKR